MLLKTVIKALKHNQKTLSSKRVKKLSIFGSVARNESTSKSVIDILVKIKGFKMQKMFLFESVARGQETAYSDIDILIKFEIPPTYDMHMDLKLFLEDLFGQNVDLVTEDALRPEL